MTMGHVPKKRKIREFKPTGKGGGSRKGKPQGSWPRLFKVVAHALMTRPKGSDDLAIEDRHNEISLEQFAEQMEAMLPGWQEEVKDVATRRRKTPLPALLWNRAYKMLYSGTSDRGKNHDPRTRAMVSKEHWKAYIPVGHPYRKIHDDIMTHKITTVKDWKKF